MQADALSSTDPIGAFLQGASPIFSVACFAAALGLGLLGLIAIVRHFLSTSHGRTRR